MDQGCVSSTQDDWPYADDVILVSSIFGMLDIHVCDQFAINIGLIFNSKKSVTMIYVQSL